MEENGNMTGKSGRNRASLVALSEKISRITQGDIQEIFDTRFGKGRVTVADTGRFYVCFHISSGPEDIYLSFIEAVWPDCPDNTEEKPRIRILFNEQTEDIIVSGHQEDDPGQKTNYTVASVLTGLLTDTALRKALSERLQAVFMMQRRLQKSIEDIDRKTEDSE